jgi:hypothetical protein
MFCQQCGQDLRPDTNFCEQCGAPVHLLGPRSDSQGSSAILVPRLLTTDELLDMASQEAQVLARTTKNLEIPFDPLTEQFQLDEEEVRWAEKEL